MNELNLMLQRDNARLPTRATEGSVGYDIFASISDDVTIKPKETILIPSGFSMELNPGYAAFIFARSSLGINNNIVPANCVGVIDNDFRGEVVIGLFNLSSYEFTVHPLDRIAQMVIIKCELPIIKLSHELNKTMRDTNGLGSTGI